MKDQAVEVITLQIHGMHCASCVGRIEAAVSRLPGVNQAEANLVTGDVRVNYLANQVTPKHIEDAIASLGYEVSATSVQPSTRRLH